MRTDRAKPPYGARPRLSSSSQRAMPYLAVADRETLLDAVLDVVGARLVICDVGPDGFVGVDLSSAGELIGIGDEPSVVALITRMLAERLSEGEVRLVGEDGRSRWLRLRCRAAPGGEHPGQQRLLAVCEDVTEEVERRDELLGRVVAAQHDERLRLARELHDGLGQTLTSASLFARSLEAGAGDAWGSTLAALRRLLEAALTETKTVIWRLRPTAVEELGFEAALEALAEQNVAFTVKGEADYGESSHRH